MKVKYKTQNIFRFWTWSSNNSLVKKMYELQYISSWSDCILRILAFNIRKTSQHLWLGLTFSIFKCHSIVYETARMILPPADFRDLFLCSIFLFIEDQYWSCFSTEFTTLERDLATKLNGFVFLLVWNKNDFPKIDKCWCEIGSDVRF